MVCFARAAVLYFKFETHANLTHPDPNLYLIHCLKQFYFFVRGGDGLNYALLCTLFESYQKQSRPRLLAAASVAMQKPLQPHCTRNAAT